MKLTGFEWVSGPVIASITQPKLKNAIGTHNGSYSVYRSIAVAAGKMDPFFVLESTATHFHFKSRVLDAAGKTPRWNQTVVIGPRSMIDELTITVKD